MREMLKPGDKVVMNDHYHVSEENRGKVWTVRSEPWNCCGTMVVKLEGKAVDQKDKAVHKERRATASVLGHL